MKIGIDLGGTTISMGLVNDRHEVVEKAEGLTCCGEGPAAVIGRMGRMARELLHKAGNPPISCAGLGCPGVLDREAGAVIYSNNIRWQQVYVCRELKEQLKVPVYVENDANCAAMGEYLAGAGRGSRQMIMVTFGTGIGGGIIFDGRLYLGSHGNANIIGHTLIEKGGRECTCKRKGCWECYASTRALLLSAEKAGVFNGMDEPELNGRLFFEVLKAGQEAALRVFDEYTDYVAEGIADLINIFDPERIVIGGGVSAQGERLLGPVREKVKQKVYFKEMETAQIVCSLLANDAAIIGAANLSAQKYGQNDLSF